MKKNARKARPPKKVVSVQAKAVSPPRNLTPELCKRLRKEMMKACSAVAEIHGLTVEGGELSDVDLRHSFEIGFRVGIPQEDGAIYSPDKAMFEVLAPHFGLEPSDYGRTFAAAAIRDAFCTYWILWPIWIDPNNAMKISASFKCAPIIRWF